MTNIFYVGDAKVGKGLFAKKEIKKGEKILELTGPIVTNAKAIELDKQKYGEDFGNGLQIGHDKYIYLQDPGRIVNHSCNPNSGIINDNELIAIRDIKKNEELTYDYSCTMDEDMWTMDCCCSEANCRKLIGDFKHLPEKTRRMYLELGVVQKYIAKKYE